MRILIFLIFLSPILLLGQNSWPKSFASPVVTNYTIIEDNDGGYLAVATFYGDNLAYILKFDAEAKLIWKKCLSFKVTPYISLNHFIKDELKNTYIIGSFYDINQNDQVAFMLKLDSCYHKVKCVIYADSILKTQQYGVWNNDINDSLLFMSGWGFNGFSNQLFIINKSNLFPTKIYNTPANSFNNSSLRHSKSVYIPIHDYFYLKDGDTSIGALRTAILKINEKGEKMSYTFFGYDENLLSVGNNIFFGKNQNLNVFSIFLRIMNDTSNLAFSPMLFECDTNCKVINYKIYRDDSVNQVLNNVLQFNDSTYFMATTYLNRGAPAIAAEKIKLYKLNGKGEVKDSFYVNNWGFKLFTKAYRGNISLIKTFDKKIMCVFPQRDSTINNTRITFLKFDENFKLDTTEHRNLNYDTGCNILENDSINLSDASICYIHADTTFQYLELKKPLNIIEVPEKYKIAFYPNPLKTNAQFEFENLKEGELLIELLDTKGCLLDVIYNLKNVPAGNTKVSLNFEKICSGQYYLLVFLNNKVIHTIKVIKE